LSKPSFAKTFTYIFGFRYSGDIAIVNERGQKLEHKYYPIIREEDTGAVTTKSAAYKYVGPDPLNKYFVEEYEVKCAELTYYTKNQNAYFSIGNNVIEGKNISKAKYWYKGKAELVRFAIY
jgi:hypothetical protein